MASANDRDQPVLKLSACDLIALHQACGGRTIYVIGALGPGAIGDREARPRPQPVQRGTRRSRAR